MKTARSPTASTLGGYGEPQQSCPLRRVTIIPYCRHRRFDSQRLTTSEPTSEPSGGSACPASMPRDVRDISRAGGCVPPLDSPASRLHLHPLSRVASSTQSIIVYPPSLPRRPWYSRMFPCMCTCGFYAHRVGGAVRRTVRRSLPVSVSPGIVVGPSVPSRAGDVTNGAVKPRVDYRNARTVVHLCHRGGSLTRRRMSRRFTTPILQY